jgi:hypothetical protein
MEPLPEIDTFARAPGGPDMLAGAQHGEAGAPSAPGDADVAREAEPG